MAVTVFHTVSWNRGNEALTKAVEIQAGSAVDIDEDVPAATDTSLALTLDVSQLKSLFVLADQNMTLETNDGTTPNQTFTLTANKPFEWYYGNGLSCPLTYDVSALYVTAATTGNLKIRTAVDPTV